MKENTIIVVATDEEYDLISGKSADVEIKFKIVEVLQNFTISGIFM